MRVKGFSGVVLALIVISFLNFAFTFQPVQASSTVYIRGDGSIEPASAPIFTADNVTYAFTGDINVSVVVERDSIVVDGAGHFIEGVGVDRGLDLVNRTSVTVKDLHVTNFTHGVRLHSCTDCLISGSNLTANKQMGVRIEFSSNNTVSGSNLADNGVYGVHLFYSSGNCISGNNITENELEGVHIELSSNNTVSGNNVANKGSGIGLYGSSSYNSVIGNNLTSNQFGIWLFSSNNSITGNTLVDDGLLVGKDFFGNRVENNTVNGKPLVYLEGVSDRVVAEAGQVILVNCTRITVKNLNISHTEMGIQLWSTDSTIHGNSITDSYIGISLGNSHDNMVSGNHLEDNEHGLYLGYSSKNNSIVGNKMVNNTYIGIALDMDSDYNRVSGNDVRENDEVGIWFSTSSSNMIFGNNISSNSVYGVKLEYSSSNRFYHNNFVDNAGQVYIEDSTNIWDDGYPSGGNYWSDYDGSDLNGGPYQNGTDGDGIGDTIYTIDGDNIDNFPLMGMFSRFNATLELDVQTVCNSSVSDFSFNGTAVSFNVTGEEGTAGFCRITIPKVLMDEPFRVFVNGTEVLPSPEPLPWSNSTHSYLHFIYHHSTQEVVVIPEFPSFLIIVLFMTVTLSATITCKRKP